MLNQFFPHFGKRVILQGLNTESLNGARGTVIDVCSVSRIPAPNGGSYAVLNNGRYTVRLDGQERLVNVRQVNVEAEG